MKCIYCDHDCKYRERPKRVCPRCGRKFAFEPRLGDPVTDKAFQYAIGQVSCDGQIRWGVEHLYYELCRRKRIKAWLRFLFLGLGCLTLVGTLISAWFQAIGPLVVFLVLTGILWLGALVAALSYPYVQLSADRFRRLYDQWVSTHGTPAGVIERSPQPQASAPREPDLADYSFDRAVICDRARTVDLLLANHFHFENSCAVLAVEGYPAGPFQVVRGMLQRNPKLQVFVLHDATARGCELAQRLASDPAWFPASASIVDVGLRPAHAARFTGLLQRRTGKPIVASEAITDWEADWLNRYELELAVIRPDQVLKRLFRAMNQPFTAPEPGSRVHYLPQRRRHASSDGGSSGDGGVVMISDASDADGPADAFG